MNKSGLYNDFSFEGLTQGKLLAIYNALQYKKQTDALSVVQEEVLDFLENHRDDLTFIAD